MNIDRGTFLLLVSTLAIGATTGYIAAEKRVFPSIDKWRGRPPEPTPEPPHPSAVADAAPVVTTPPPPPPPPAPAAPACDDSVATVGECPPPGYPTVEGGCGSFANVRCGELKQAMKPKVAAAAVACLNKLTPQERCDPARVQLCGHLAFMNACPETEASAGADAGAGASAGADASAGAGAGGTNAHAAAMSSGPKSAGIVCQAIVEGCGASPVSPSMTECKQLLSGMTDTGRERTRACMKAHCFDRGLVGCEAIASVK